MHFILILSIFASYYLLGGEKCLYSITVRKRQVVIMGLLLFLFAALRAYTVGYDVENYYYPMYSSGVGYSLREWYANYSSRDPGFYLFIGFLHKISPNPQLMLIVVGAVVAFGFSYFTYYEKGSVILFYLMFIGFRLFAFTLSGLRQALAMGFIFIVYIQLRKDRALLSLLLIGIASTIHASALIFILAFPLMRMKNTSLLILLISGISVFNLLSDGMIANFIANTFFYDRFAGYIKRSQEMVFEGSFTLYIYLLIYLFSLLLYRQLKSKDELFIKDFHVLTLGVFFAILGQSMDNVFRIAYYFIYSLYPVFGLVILTISKGKLTSGIIVFIVSVLLSAQYLYFGPGAGTYPYHFFWELSF